ncbi:MAG: hypothetical protein GPJ01_06580 [Microcystis aeruginosa LL13-06]|uniref:hypothetical protein n=1 Tax=Microcystis sp. LSC13-02 TaxID=1895004 RepID=UPI00257CDC73|nr:hypothetical protein [Microcystis sp. LSC13-02]NCR37137.1 hypothetical protein [Microcystis aeruginosa S11-05]NCR50655.1 hypothetical protein [Microcystis aeruginosa S11-01]NCR57481.1 hypothetical protein [Microcystis aeruginosa LL13-06]
MRLPILLKNQNQQSPPHARRYTIEERTLHSNYDTLVVGKRQSFKVRRLGGD